MARSITPERQKLRLDAIRIRQELGWSERQIVDHLNTPKTTIHQWLVGNTATTVVKNNTPLSPNNIYCMLCLTGTLTEVLGRLTREQAEDFVDERYLVHGVPQIRVHQKEINSRVEKQASLL